MTGPPRRDHAWTPSESHVFAGPRTGDYFVSLYDYIMCCQTERTAMFDTWT